MHIRKIHSHGEGQACFEIKSSRNGRLTDAGLILLNGETFAVGYLGYSGHWYAYNIDTGKEIASFTKEFYETFLVLYRVCSLGPEPNCVPSRTPQQQRGA